MNNIWELKAVNECFCVEVTYTISIEIFLLNEVISFFVGFGFLAGFLEEQMYRWLRAAELTCDRAALLVVQDPKVPIFSTN